MNIFIIGCGSIGNHLANASRRQGWRVYMHDVDPDAIKRTKEEIYPARYGTWDDEINFIEFPNDNSYEFDLIIIGTPPDTHIELALKATKLNPKAILIEKPLCGLDLSNIGKLVEVANLNKIMLFMGYDHSISKVVSEVKSLLEKNDFGKVSTLDVDFRENWDGIFSAHPWLDGPSDTYLGFSNRGGGAGGEHSHGIHLWQFLAKLLNQGNVKYVNGNIEIFKDSKVNYDKLFLINIKTEKGLIGRCVQDVVTKPSRKWARIQFESGFIEISFTPKLDTLTYQKKEDSEPTFLNFTKDRPSDFILELEHIDKCLKGEISFNNSPIHINQGIEVMQIIEAAYKANELNDFILINNIIKES